MFDRQPHGVYLVGNRVRGWYEPSSVEDQAVYGSLLRRHAL
jgi:hypothetical protein